MAQQVTVALVDDLDGTVSEDVSPVKFGLDGVEYEIDLTEDNTNRLRDTLADFIAAARRARGRRTRRAPSATSVATDRERTKAIRKWAREHGYELAERGRIAAHVIAAYEEGRATSTKPKARRGRSKARGRAAA